MGLMPLDGREAGVAKKTCLDEATRHKGLQYRAIASLLLV